MDERFLNELYDLICEVSERNEKLNVFHINAIKYLYCKYNDVSQYTCNLNMSKIDNNNTLGLFNVVKRNIVVDVNKIEEETNTDDILEYNLNVLRVLLHELTHAAHNKTIFNKEYLSDDVNVNTYKNVLTTLCTSINGIPFMLSFDDFNPSDNDIVLRILHKMHVDNINNVDLDKLYNFIYFDQYTYNVDERIADITAFRIIKDMLPKDNRLYKKYYIKYLKSLIRGYTYDEASNEYICPTDTYFKNLGIEDELNRQKKYLVMLK